MNSKFQKTNKFIVIAECTWQASASFRSKSNQSWTERKRWIIRWNHLRKKASKIASLAIPLIRFSKVGISPTKLARSVNLSARTWAQIIWMTLELNMKTIRKIMKNWWIKDILIPRENLEQVAQEEVIATWSLLLILGEAISRETKVKISRMMRTQISNSIIGNKEWGVTKRNRRGKRINRWASRRVLKKRRESGN